MLPSDDCVAAKKSRISCSAERKEPCVNLYKYPTYVVTNNANNIAFMQSPMAENGLQGTQHWYSEALPPGHQLIIDGIRGAHSYRWFLQADKYVIRVDFTDVIVDAYGGSCAALQIGSSSDSFKSIDAQQAQQRGLLRYILSLFELFMRMTIIRSHFALDRRSGFGYGGQTSNACVTICTSVRRAQAV